MSRPFRAYRTVDGARLFAMLDNGDDHDIMWMAPDEWPNNHDTAIFGPEWLPVFAAWPGGCEIVPVDPPRPAPDAIDAATEYLANGIAFAGQDYAEHLGRLIRWRRAVLAEVDRRIAAALAPAELADRMGAAFEADTTLTYTATGADCRRIAARIRAKEAGRA
jgi:hypothetical protein